MQNLNYFIELLKCWSKGVPFLPEMLKRNDLFKEKFMMIIVQNIMQKWPCKWGCNQCELRQIIHFQYFEDNIARTPTWKSHPRIKCTTLCFSSSNFSLSLKTSWKFPGLKLLSLRFEFSFAYFYPYGLFSAQMEQNRRSQRPDVCTNSAKYNLRHTRANMEKRKNGSNIFMLSLSSLC